MGAAPDFLTALSPYKQAIDADIAAYSAHARQVTKTQFGPYSSAVTNAYLDMLERGGKRIRGALVMVGYDMLGGTNTQMIVRAATALEMIHAYLLVIDDIQDRSVLRRGQPTVHAGLAAYQRHQGWRGDHEHGGLSLALNAGLAGMHAAQILLSGLDVEPQLRLNVMAIVNQTVVTTLHGQTNDIANELMPKVTMQSALRTLEWKSAHYTFLNPLCVGMVLAGAGCEDTDAIRDYALHAGRAFQISDDILGVFGLEAEIGKSPIEDIREGKRTVLTVHALTHASKADHDFLQHSLGNARLSAADFKKCQAVIKRTGSLDYAQGVAKENIAQALVALQKERHRWNIKGVTFLHQIAEYLATRTA